MPTQHHLSLPPAGELTADDLRRAGQAVRHNREVLNNCWYINRDLRDLLVAETLNDEHRPWEDHLDVKWVVASDRDQEAYHGEHYVLFLDASLVDDDLATNGQILVDAALDQFNDQQLKYDTVPFSLGGQREIASVVVAPPEDEFRQTVYHSDVGSMTPEEDLTCSLPL